MKYRDILYATEDGIATITLNRPDKLNAFRAQTVDELTQALLKATQDRSVGVIVITGAGGKAFCVGGDIGEMKLLNKKTGAVFITKLLKLGKSFLDCPKPIIAKVDGYCIGGGNEIQLFCDLTYASTRSTFGQTGPKVGSAPLWGGSQMLPLLIGLKKAKEVTFLCKTYSAEEAARIGLINEAVPEGELDRRVGDVCRELLSRSPQSLKLLKKSFHASIGNSLKRDMQSLRSIYGSTELGEGMGAFLEKRRPDFSRFR